MEFEELVKINDEINSLEDDSFFNGLEIKVDNLFTDFNQNEIKELVNFNDRLNQYISFIQNGAEIYFSKKIKQRIKFLKEKVYVKTEELINYKQSLEIINDSFVDLKKYAYALDFVLSNKENGKSDNSDALHNLSLSYLDKYFRDIIIINEIKKGICDTSKSCSHYGNKPAQKIISYSNLLEDFIQNELNSVSQQLSAFEKKFKLYKANTSQEKIYMEEMNMQLQDCMDLLKK